MFTNVGHTIRSVYCTNITNKPLSTKSPFTHYLDLMINYCITKNKTFILLAKEIELRKLFSAQTMNWKCCSFNFAYIISGVFCFLSGGNMLFRSTQRSRQSPSKSPRRTHKSVISKDWISHVIWILCCPMASHPPHTLCNNHIAPGCFEGIINSVSPGTFTTVISPLIHLFFQICVSFLWRFVYAFSSSVYLHLFNCG